MSVNLHDRILVPLLGVVLLAWPAGARADPPATAQPGHFFSPEIVAALSQQLPSYVPLAPNGTSVTGMAAHDDEDDMLHLAKVTVKRGGRPRLSLFEVLSPTGRLDLALQNYPGLRLVPFAQLNNGIALEMQLEEREAGKRTAVAEEVTSLAVVNDARSKENVRLMRDATARPNTDWQTGLGAPR